MAKVSRRLARSCNVLNLLSTISNQINWVGIKLPTNVLNRKYKRQCWRREVKVNSPICGINKVPTGVSRGDWTCGNYIELRVESESEVDRNDKSWLKEVIVIADIVTVFDTMVTLYRDWDR